jgi:hypothetical protein
MPKVYVPNRSIHDYSPAERFGELVFLSHGNVRKAGVSRAFRQFYKSLKDSEPEDFLLVAGLTMLNLVACYILTKLHGKVNLLIFRNSKEGEKYYVPRTLFWEDEL